MPIFNCVCPAKKKDREGKREKEKEREGEREGSQQEFFLRTEVHAVLQHAENENVPKIRSRFG